MEKIIIAEMLVTGDTLTFALDSTTRLYACRLLLLGAKWFIAD